MNEVPLRFTGGFSKWVPFPEYEVLPSSACTPIPDEVLNLVLHMILNCNKEKVAGPPIRIPLDRYILPTCRCGRRGGGANLEPNPSYKPLARFSV